MGRGSSGAVKTGGKVKYISSDKTLTASKPIYITRELGGYGGGSVLNATTDGNGNISLDYNNNRLETYKQTSKTTVGLYELKNGITDMRSQDSKTDWGEVRPKTGDIKSVGIEWSNVKSISGKTYGYGEFFKEKGFKWNRDSKRWEK